MILNQNGQLWATGNFKAEKSDRISELKSALANPEEEIKQSELESHVEKVNKKLGKQGKVGKK